MKIDSVAGAFSGRVPLGKQIVGISQLQTSRAIMRHNAAITPRESNVEGIRKIYRIIYALTFQISFIIVFFYHAKDYENCSFMKNFDLKQQEFDLIFPRRKYQGLKVPLGTFKPNQSKCKNKKVYSIQKICFAHFMNETDTFDPFKLCSKYLTMIFWSTNKQFNQSGSLIFFQLKNIKNLNFQNIVHFYSLITHMTCFVTSIFKINVHLLLTANQHLFKRKRLL
eukprot:TRINITY_DN1930_c1_g1_i16.p1 TRINITY_DN1930_c1_g1~~TRINITY_DN1930_c1_g1_i16.p1  ORF type:complete len:224 (-),score=-16.09 TRINITY_DN1930_c1_g1_i16:138-809(-)